MTLQERLREVAIAQRVQMPTVAEATARARKFADEAKHIVQLSAASFDKAVLVDALDALQHDIERHIAIVSEQEARIRQLEGLLRALVHECESIPFQNKAEFSLAVGNAREALK